MRTLAISVLTLLATQGLQVTNAQCDAQGMTLDMTAGRIGDGFTIDITGSPFVPGLIAMGVSPGPITLPPIGTLCVGLVPPFFTVPFTMPAGGSLTMEGVIAPSPAFEGVWYEQAVAFDPSQPSGWAISNADQVDLYPPRVYVLDVGMFILFGTDIPAQIVGYNALNDNLEFQTSFNPNLRANDAAWIPETDSVMVLLADGTVQSLNGETGNVDWSTPYGSNPSDLLPLDTGNAHTILFSRSLTDPIAGVTTISAVRLLDSTTGASLNYWTPTSFATRIIQVPGIAKVFLTGGTHVEYRAALSGSLLSFIDADTGNGDIIDWMILGDRLWVLFGGTEVDIFGIGNWSPSALYAFDLDTGQPALTGAVEMVAPNQKHATLFRAGPGTLADDSIMVLFSDTGSGGVLESQIWEMDPVSLLPVTIRTVASTKITHMALSSGRTDWFLLQSGAPQTSLLGGVTVPGWDGLLFRMDPATLFIDNILETYPQEYQGGLFTLPSLSQPKLYVTSGAGNLYSYPTDPASGPGNLSTMGTAEAYSAVVTTN